MVHSIRTGSLRRLLAHANERLHGFPEDFTKALLELDIDWKTAECGQEKSLSLLEDEQGTHKQDHNRFNAMKKKAEAVDIGSEMKKPEGLIVPTRRQNFSTVASAPRRSLDGAPRRGAGGIV